MNTRPVTSFAGEGKVTRSNLNVGSFLILLQLCAGFATADVELRHVDVFTSGTEGYHTFRIPGIAVSGDGTLIAFAEGRVVNFSDPGAGYPIDLVYKRSTDGGRTWSPVETLGVGDTDIGAFQPTVVVDLESGRNRVWCFYNWRNATATRPADKGLVARYSDDNGLTWSAQMDFNYLDPGGTPNFTANLGSGIQMLDGRLVVPMKIKFSGLESQGTIIYSDDNGTTWHVGGTTEEGANEHQVVELTHGRLLDNARRNGTSANRRQSYSPDGGESWGLASSSLTIGDDVACGIERYTWAGLDGETVNRILFSAPAGGGSSPRSRLTLFTSTDEGASYGHARLAAYGRSAYSDLARTEDRDVCGVLWERGDTGNYQYITYTAFDREFLEPTVSPGRIAYEGFTYPSSPSMGFQFGGNGWNSSWKAQTDLDVETAADAGIDDGFVTHSEFAFTGSSAHLSAGGTLVRGLGTGIDMNQNQTRYISMLVSKEGDVSPNGGSGEYLNIFVEDASGNHDMKFGVNSSEGFYVNWPGTPVSGPSNAIDTNSAVLLVAKILTQDDAAGHYDQIFLKTFASGETIPGTDAQISWTLTGTTNENSSAVMDRIKMIGGPSADWSIDEIRVGSTWSSVTLEIDAVENFETYDVENPSDFSIGAAASGNWAASDMSVDATRIFDTANFGGSRLWVSRINGASITSKAITVQSNTAYYFSAALVCETSNASREMEATYDLLIGQHSAAATSLIGGPVTVTAHGDDWLIPDSKADHVFTQEFSTGALSPGDKLFVVITRVAPIGADSWFGVDDMLVAATPRDHIADATAPTPDPMTFSVPPIAMDATSISMTATNAADVSGVEYYFEETSGNSGGTTSGWQTNTVYVDSGLAPNATYSYRVRARDKSVNQNTGSFSAIGSASTDGDYDGDAIPDWWEIQHFGNPISCIPTSDADLDSHDNLDEYIAGMNPTDSNSVFLITNCDPSAGVLIEWPGVANRWYEILWTPDLTNTFQSLDDFIDYPQNSYTDTVHHGDSAGFYRVEVRLK